MEFKEKRKIEIDFRGEHYPSLSALARAYDVKPTAFISRYRTGKYTLEQCLFLEDIEKSPSAGRKLEYKGVTYSSIREMATALGVSYAQLCFHLRVLDYDTSKLDLDEQVVRYNSDDIELTVEGVTYDSFYDLASHYGLSTVTVRSRVRMLGWSLEESVGLKERLRGNSKKFKTKK